MVHKWHCRIETAVSDLASEKGVKLPTLDGDGKKFQLWWTRFCAYASVYTQARNETCDDVLSESEAESLIEALL